MRTTLYLHGFLSSPRSRKGMLLKAEHEARGMRFLAPDLTLSPKEASDVILEVAKSVPPGLLTVVGSSLGGFYAGWVAERIGCRAVLINPAVRPWAFVRDFLGEQTVYGTGRKVLITEDYERQLRELDTPSITIPSRYFVLLSTGDEVLDWHEADRKYRQSPRVLVEGGDHQVSCFERYVRLVADYCADPALQIQTSDLPAAT